MLFVTHKTYADIVNHLKDGKKISAIKRLRLEKGVSLREAKFAIDKFSMKLESRPWTGDPSAEDIACAPVIQKIVCDLGQGSVELNIEELQIKFLSSLALIGVDACAELLHIIDVLQAINDRKEVKIIDD